MTTCLIAGGTGMIGQALTRKWQDMGYQIIILGRDAEKIQKTFGDKVTPLTWQDFDEAPAKHLQECDIVVNLCGANIGEKRWSYDRKRVILHSRVKTTEKISRALATLGASAPRLLNASAIGVYGLQEIPNDDLGEALVENSPLGDGSDFLSAVGKQWEEATTPAQTQGVNVVLMRFGVVLSQNGGALPKMAMPFYFGMGGPIGNGRQVLSWVSLTTLVNMIDFVFNDPSIQGPVNMVSRKACHQREFAEALGRVLNRPSFMPTPAFVLKTVFGQMAEELLLNGQYVVPQRLNDRQCPHMDDDIESALRTIYKRSS